MLALFDDKIGQKYLLEALGIPFINSHVFYDKYEAIKMGFVRHLFLKFLNLDVVLVQKMYHF